MGEVYSWGMGTNLQLRMSDEEDQWSPVRVSAGGQHTAILMTTNFITVVPLYIHTSEKSNFHFQFVIIYYTNFNSNNTK